MRQPDLAAPVMDGVSFADINRDMDTSTFGCTGQASVCHGPGTKAPLLLKANGLKDMAALMANYSALVPKEVDTANATISRFLVIPFLDENKGGIRHTGGKYAGLDPGGAIYNRWLKWIKLGAKFEYRPFSDLPKDTPDMAAVTDMAATGDLGDGGK